MRLVVVKGKGHRLTQIVLKDETTFRDDAWGGGLFSYAFEIYSMRRRIVNFDISIQSSSKGIRWF